jgi:hypothetical protein
MTLTCSERTIQLEAKRLTETLAKELVTEDNIRLGLDMARAEGCCGDTLHSENLLNMQFIGLCAVMLQGLSIIRKRYPMRLSSALRP